MGLLSKIFSNTRKPEGFFGKMMVNGMNGGGHAQMANWALSSVQIKEDDQILDIGCGGGANIARLLQRVPKGVVQGIDYSSVSVAKSSKVNAKAIAEGRCKVQEASVVKLPFGESTFDLVTAFDKPEEIRLHLSNAGFKGINIRKDEAKHWLMVTVEK